MALACGLSYCTESRLGVRSVEKGKVLKAPLGTVNGILPNAELPALSSCPNDVQA